MLCEFGSLPTGRLVGSVREERRWQLDDILSFAVDLVVDKVMQFRLDLL